MIPDKKKTPEEIAALRDGLGIPLAPVATEPAIAPPPPPVVGAPLPTAPEVLEEPDPDEPVFHLNVPPVPTNPARVEAVPIHSLRRSDPPLAAAPAVTHKTALPSKRHDPSDIAEIRRRETLAQLQQKDPSHDPAAHLRRQKASPFLYVPGYLLAIAAAAVAYQRVHHVTPLALLGLASLIMIFIAVRKPRSRHHAALLFILIFLTLALGGVHYAPLFKHGP